MNCIQVPKQGPYGEMYPFTGIFYISFKTCIKIAPNKNFFLSKALRKYRTSIFPKSKAPYRSRHPFPEPYLTYLSGSPVKEPFLQIPFMESLRGRCPVIRALLHSSFKVPSI
jgi:hypothetical protein